MSSTTRFAYDVSTGEHVMLGQANAPAATNFTKDVLDKQSQRDKRLARKQRQRARKRAEKRAAMCGVTDKADGPISTASTHATQAAKPNASSHPPPVLSLLEPAAERIRYGRALIAVYLRDTCFALLHATHPAQRPIGEDNADYAGRLQRATEEWVAALVLYRRALDAGELTVHSGIAEVAAHTQTLLYSADAEHEHLYVATLEAWKEQLKEVVGV